MANEKSGSLATFKADDKDKPKTFPVLLTALLPQFTAALPAHLKANAERYTRVALTEFRKNPKLSECDPYNVLACALTATQLGLEVGLMGQAYIVPFFNKRLGMQEATLIPGYQGLIALAMRSGMLDALYARVVYEGDEFSFTLGTKEEIRHISRGEEDESKITHAYAVAHIKGSSVPVFEVMPVGKVLKIRDAANRIGASHYSHDHWEEYCRKTAIRRLVKYLPKSAELVMAAELDELAASGKAQNINVEKVVTGEWMPEHDEESAPAGSPKGGAVAASSKQEGGGLPQDYSNAQADAFAQADDLVKSKDFAGAKAMLDKLHPRDRKLIEQRLPR